MFSRLVAFGVFLAVGTASLCLDWCSESSGYCCLWVCGDIRFWGNTIRQLQEQLTQADQLRLIGEPNTISESECRLLLSRQDEQHQLILQECNTEQTSGCQWSVLQAMVLLWCVRIVQFWNHNFRNHGRTAGTPEVVI